MKTRENELKEMIDVVIKRFISVSPVAKIKKPLEFSSGFCV
jgi:hypothetical protein